MFSGKFTDRGSFTGDGFVFAEAGDVAVAFTGEVYGFKASAESAAQHIARLYSERGSSCFATLDGSFAAIVWDGAKTLIARDHHGTGPQVYYTSTHYASSLSQAKALSVGGCEADAASLGQFLNTGYIGGGKSSLTGVGKLPAGSMLIHEGGTASVVNLFETDGITPAADDGRRSAEDYAAEYGNLHEAAIGRRIEGSRNVGILLSGGYDSGGNLAALRRIYNGKVSSYSIGFRGDNWTELPLARCMSETFGTEHHEYEIDGSEIAALPEIVAHLGDPFVEGGLMVNYAAMRMIGGDKPDVILGGDGSDQYFGTSGREIALHYLAARYGLRPLMTLACRALGAAEGNDRAYRLKFHLDKILHILHGDVFGFDPPAVAKLVREPNRLEFPPDAKPDTRSFEHLYTQHIYTTDIGRIIDSVILFKASRMAEMFGNRIAFPYLDRELYDFLQRLPVGYKCAGESPLQIAKGNFTAKYLLKKRYKPMLPEAVTERKKQGGFAPMPIFFADRQRRAVLGEFIMESAAARDFLRRDTVEGFLRGYDAESEAGGRWFWYRQNRAIQFFNLLTLAVWWEIFVEGKTGVRF